MLVVVVVGVILWCCLFSGCNLLWSVRNLTFTEASLICLCLLRNRICMS